MRPCHLRLHPMPQQAWMECNYSAWLASPFEKGGARGIYLTKGNSKSPLPPFFKGGNSLLKHVLNSYDGVKLNPEERCMEALPPDSAPASSGHSLYVL